LRLGGGGGGGGGRGEGGGGGGGGGGGIMVRRHPGDDVELLFNISGPIAISISETYCKWHPEMGTPDK